jgi:4,5:9,10-diseco-3-hydroxy-5,9,17-trioxoandrosta-1(10),2-diene-4-oate hydrolase
MQLYDPRLLSEEIINERAPIALTQTQAARSVMIVPNMTERLGELRCPVFGFWGMNDLFNPVGGAMKLMQHAPQARILLVNQCGHWVQVEHQAMFNRQCIDFLQNG